MRHTARISHPNLPTFYTIFQIFWHFPTQLHSVKFCHGWLCFHKVSMIHWIFVHVGWLTFMWKPLLKWAFGELFVSNKFYIKKRVLGGRVEVLIQCGPCKFKLKTPWTSVNWNDIETQSQRKRKTTTYFLSLFSRESMFF